MMLEVLTCFLVFLLPAVCSRQQQGEQPFLCQGPVAGAPAQGVPTGTRLCGIR